MIWALAKDGKPSPHLRRVADLPYASEMKDTRPRVPFFLLFLLKAFDADLKINSLIDRSFITTNLCNFLLTSRSSYIGNNTWMGNDGRDNDAKKAYEGVLNIEQKFGTEMRTGDKVTAFVNRVKRRLKDDPFNVEIPENGTVRYTVILEDYLKVILSKWKEL